jgi:hypothetical protein
MSTKRLGADLRVEVQQVQSRRFSRYLAVVCGNDLVASALTVRLHAEGWSVVMCERVDPPAIWRGMTFTDAWYVGKSMLAGQSACFCASIRSVQSLLDRGYIAATTWSSAAVADSLQADCIFDARAQVQPTPSTEAKVLSISREHTNNASRRIAVPRDRIDISPALNGTKERSDIMAPTSGRLVSMRHIGEHVRKGDVLGRFDGTAVVSPCTGVVMGIAARGALVSANSPLGSIDPYNDPLRCFGPDSEALRLADEMIELFHGGIVLQA